MLLLLASAAFAAAPPACPRPAAAPADARPADHGTVLVTLPDTGAAASFRAWGVELRLDGPGRPAAGRAPAAAPGEVRLTRAIDARTAAASRQRVAAQRLPVVWLEYGGPAAGDAAAPAEGTSAGTPAGTSAGTRVRLANVTVVSQRLVFPEPPDALEDQVASLSADVCQLRAERAEAARRLSELEALDRRKLAAAFELARAGDQVGVLDARLAAAERRLALLAARAARAARPTEELTLRAEQAEVVADVTAAPGDAARRTPAGR